RTGRGSFPARRSSDLTESVLNSLESATAEILAAARPAGHRRVLLKLSGEALMGDDAYGINRDTLHAMVGEIAGVAALGVELAIRSEEHTSELQSRENL